jgi:uncharacterized membrane protein YfcA
VTGLECAALAVILLLTSAVGVVTGSTSLVSVPALLLFGVEPRTAVATNMLGLTFMSAGGALPFLKTPALDRERLPTLTTLTIISSIIGALLVFAIPPPAMPGVIAVAMLAVVVFTLTRPTAGLSASSEPPSGRRLLGAYALTFALGVYGGFFSGGYVTVLTVVFVALLGHSFLEAVSTTKVLNVFSSLVATGIFIARGAIDYRLGVLVSVAMFVGGYAGGRLTLRMNQIWLRRVFISTVAALAITLLVYDLLWTSSLARW